MSTFKSLSSSIKGLFALIVLAIFSKNLQDKDNDGYSYR